MTLKSLIPSRHLLIQSQQQKHQNEASTTPKLDSKDKQLISIYIHIYTHIHIYTYTYTYTYTYIHTHIHTHMHTHIYTSMHIDTYIYITANPEHIPHTAPAAPSPIPNMQLPAEYLQLKLKLKSYENAKSNSNM